MRLRRLIKRSLFVLLALLAVSGFAMQQATRGDQQPFSITPSTALLTLAAVVAAVMTLSRFAERQIDSRLLAVDSPLAKHVSDPMAHEAMRKTLAEEYDAQFKLLHDMVDSYRREDGARLTQIRTEMIAPLIELNNGQRQVASDTLRCMADAISGLADAMKMANPTIRLRE